MGDSRAGGGLSTLRAKMDDLTSAPLTRNDPTELFVNMVYPMSESNNLKFEVSLTDENLSIGLSVQ